MTVFLFILNTFILSCGTLGYDWTASYLLWQFSNLPYFFYVLLVFLRL